MPGNVIDEIERTRQVVLYLLRCRTHLSRGNIEVKKKVLLSDWGQKKTNQSEIRDLEAIKMLGSYMLMLRQVKSVEKCQDGSACSQEPPKL